MKTELLSHARKIVQNFLDKKHKKPPVVVVVGATASGKTWLSVALAQEFGGEILSADSRQIWREFDIGTAKATPAEMAGVPHHLLDCANADETFTLWDWKTRAEKIMAELCARGKLPIIAGGTGLYVEALLKNFQIPAFSAAERAELEARWERGEHAEIWQELKNLCPQEAEKFSPNSKLHLLRALEIARQSERKTASESQWDFLLLGIRWPRPVRTERITKRVRQMVEEGLVAEVENLLQKYSANNPAMSGIGYAEIVRHLRGEITLGEAIELIAIHTRQYAKRQDTWWRRHPEVVWLETGEN